MKVTFLIGNGFDINLGLRTTYKDFYNNYLKTLDPKIIRNNILYRYIQSDIENWVDFETSLGLLTFPPKSEDIYKKNFLEQARSLSDVDNFVDNDLNWKNDFSPAKFLSALTDFRKDFKNYLIKESNKIEDYNNLLGPILHNGLVNFAKDYNENEKIGIYSNMYGHTLSFNNSNDLSIDYSFLTFNYTEFLEKGRIHINSSLLSSSLLRNFKDEEYDSLNISTKIGPVYHIHSKLNGGMFLGVDNESQLNFELFSKKELATLIKPLSNETHNNYVVDRADKEIESSDIIVIFGTALGVTDSTWWKKIIEFLLMTDNNIVLIHKFDSEVNNNEDDFFTLEDKKNEVKEHLLSFDKSLTKLNYNRIKKQIFVNLNSKDIFNSDILINRINSGRNTNAVNKNTLIKTLIN